ncbi:CBU_0592 family membrane protein [Sphingomonas jaspsi]|uniref:CBU_0592 family membrane protein n=1 Tax=Sphingomonas jaspsi TaxID=392409 RepID=UPI0004AD8934|nr:hypothetical protein [Sphingomonas jaspsi]
MLVAAGMIGVLLGMLNYGLLVTGRVVSDGPAYLVLNIVAAALVLSSLFEQFNLPTLMINAFYGGVSIWGLWRNYVARSRTA